MVRKQLAFMLGRQQVFVNIIQPREEGDMEDEEEDEVSGFEDADDLIEIMANIHLNNNFLALAREVSGDVIMM